MPPGEIAAMAFLARLYDQSGLPELEGVVRQARPDFIESGYTPLAAIDQLLEQPGVPAPDSAFRAEQIIVADTKSKNGLHGEPIPKARSTIDRLAFSFVSKSPM